MKLLPGLSDVIGHPTWHDGLMFVPILGRFRYSLPRFFLHKHADLSFMKQVADEEALFYDSLWVRARLINLFGINHQTSRSMSTLLNFQGVCIDFTAKPEIASITPFLLSDTWKGIGGDYGYDGKASIAFPNWVEANTRARVAGVFWSLLRSAPTGLGVFRDYLESDGALFSVDCDGAKIRCRLEYSPNEDWWPFEFPKCRQRRSRQWHLR